MSFNERLIKLGKDRRQAFLSEKQESETKILEGKRRQEIQESHVIQLRKLLSPILEDVNSRYLNGKGELSIEPNLNKLVSVSLRWDQGSDGRGTYETSWGKYISISELYDEEDMILVSLGEEEKKRLNIKDGDWRTSSEQFILDGIKNSKCGWSSTDNNPY